MSIHNIFEVPIYQVQLDLDIESIQLFCNKHQQKDSGRTISNVGGYQSNDLDLNNTILTSLVEQIQTHSTKFANKLFDEPTTSCIENIWFNVNKYRNTNKCHNHPNQDISGVYYVKTPDECGNIIFNNPAMNIENIWFDWSSYNSKNKTLPVSKNTLYLFPSWLNHYVEPNMNKTEERISFSFNTR